MAYFNPHDRNLIEAATFDLDSQPAFETIKACLVWPDESPKGMSREGYEKLCDLWVARGMLHQGEQLAELPPTYRSAWESALAEGPSWPGFRRVKLSAMDRRYLEDQLRELQESGDGV